MTFRTIESRSGAHFWHHAISTEPFLNGICHYPQQQDEENSTTGKKRNAWQKERKKNNKKDRKNRKGIKKKER